MINTLAIALLISLTAAVLLYRSWRHERSRSIATERQLGQQIEETLRLAACLKDAQDMLEYQTAETLRHKGWHQNTRYLLAYAHRENHALRVQLKLASGMRLLPRLIIWRRRLDNDGDDVGIEA